VYLPQTNDWYDFITKQRISPPESSADNFNRTLGMLEIAVYTKAGSIIPQLLHQNTLALMRAINNPIEL
jgi:alpha-glucosidase (family GH31 glycosyl hydrolase)